MYNHTWITDVLKYVRRIFSAYFSAYFLAYFSAYFPAYSLAYFLASPGVFPGVFFGEVALLKTCASTLGVFFRRIFCGRSIVICKHLRTKKSQEKSGRLRH